jgi:hypothetical protein
MKFLIRVLGNKSSSCHEVHENLGSDSHTLVKDVNKFLSDTFFNFLPTRTKFRAEGNVGQIPGRRTWAKFRTEGTWAKFHAEGAWTKFRAEGTWAKFRAEDTWAKFHKKVRESNSVEKVVGPNSVQKVRGPNSRYVGQIPYRKCTNNPVQHL